MFLTSNLIYLDINSCHRKLQQSSLLSINDSNIFCLILEQHNLLVLNRIDKKKTYCIKVQSKYPDEPFYFPSDILQFEWANEKFIWLNKTNLQILDDTSGKVVKSIEVDADKFILDSQSNICLTNKTAKKLQVYGNLGSLLEENLVEQELLDQPLFLDWEDKFIYFNKNTFDLYLQ